MDLTGRPEFGRQPTSLLLPALLVESAGVGKQVAARLAKEEVRGWGPQTYSGHEVPPERSQVPAAV